MSDLGYRNKTQGRLSIRANSLAEYLAGIRSAVTTEEPRYAAIGVVVDGEYRQLNANILQIENEYYSTIRPKPSKASKPGRSLRSAKRGVDYVEVRTLDLNSADPVGMNQSELRFIEALLIYCLLAESPPISAAEQAEIDARDLTVAREGRRPGLDDRRRRARAAAARARARARSPASASVAELLDADAEGYVAAVDAAAEALRDPERTPSAGAVGGVARPSRRAFSSTRSTLARTHAAYFRDFALGAAREQALVETARRSLEEAEALAAKDSRPFADYLRRLLRPDLGAPAIDAGPVFVIPLTARRGLAARILSTFGHSRRA